MASTTAAHLASVASGFWGKPTSNVDWCERNYEFSPYFQETFNTWSNLFYIIPSLAHLYLVFHFRMPHRFYWLAAALLSVGVGSFWFHLTLSRISQDADEFSMLFGVALYFYGVCEDDPSKTQYPWLLPALTVFLIIAFFAMIVFHAVPNLFRSVFGMMIFALLARYFVLHRTTRHPTIRKMIRLWVVLWLAAFSVWLIDNHCCEFLSSFSYPTRAFLQFHALWHVLTGTSCYVSLTLGAYVFFEKNAQTEAQMPHLKWACCGLFPYVVPPRERSDLGARAPGAVKKMQ